MGIGAAFAKITGYFGILGGTDNTIIGNTGDRLKVDIIGSATVNNFPIATIQKNVEFSINQKVETDISGTSYTVTSGKKFYLCAFTGASDSPSPVSMRLKAYNGATLVNTVKLVIAGNGAHGEYLWATGVEFANASYTIKATFDPQSAKGSGWVMFAGYEL